MNKCLENYSKENCILEFLLDDSCHNGTAQVLMLLEQALVPLFTNEPTNKLPCFSLFLVSTRCFEFLIPSLLKNHLHNGLMQLNGGCLSNPYLGFLAKCIGEVPPNGNVKVYQFIHQFSSESSNTQPILDF